MTLLDRFRTQPRQKHPDPTVRLAYVAELPLSERDLIVAAAREDDDVRVRRAAVAKLMDPSALAAIARNDADTGVRDEALAMLRDIALDSFEGVDEAESLAAVDAIGDARTLAQIAKTSLREPVGRRALARLEPMTDSHTLASIARHAALEPIRQAAFDQLHDRADILTVAINGEFKDTATAAVNRLSDRDDLDQVVARAKNKAAAKRASAVLRELDERAAREAAVLAVPVDHMPDAPVAPVVPMAIDAAAPAAEAARAPVEVVEDVEGEAALARDEARTRAEAAAAERARKEEEEKEKAALEAAERARQEEEKAEAERSIREAAAQAAAKEAEAEAEREAERRRLAEEAEGRVRREGLHRLNQLLGRADALAAMPDVALKTASRVLRDVRAALADIPPLPSRREYDEVVQRLKAAQAALTPKVQDLREVAEWQQWANIGIQEQLCEKMEALRALDDSEAIARRIHELQQQWREAADVPRAQGEALWRRFKAVHDELWAKCEAHFAAQASVRAEHLAKKAALCEHAEALVESTNWLQTAEAIKGLQAEWKTVGPVTRGQEKAIWDRFRAACDRFFTRRQDDLVKRKAIWAENFAKKEALCLAVEALAGSSDWEATSTEIRRLQAEWKIVGPVKKSRSDAIWQRFRAACDGFFARYAQRHDIARAERVAAREAICAEIEALAPPPPEGEAASAAQGSAGEPPADLAATVRTLRTRWQQELAACGVDREQAATLDRRYADACRRVISRWPTAFAGTDLDPDANRKRMEALVTRMEELAAALSGLSGQSGSGAPGEADVSPTTRLAAMLKEALAANTIGGKVDVESRRRAAQEDVRQAQASWSRIGPVADEARRALAERFQRAVKQISGAGGAGRAG
jgi:hypothetical protein